MDLIGLMDKVVAFQVNTPAASGAGNRDIYTTAVTTRGYLKYGSGSRNGGFQDIQADQSWSLTVRKQAALTAILSVSLKVVIESQTYTVQGWADINEDHFYYKFSLTRQNA